MGKAENQNNVARQTKNAFIASTGAAVCSYLSMVPFEAAWQQYASRQSSYVSILWQNLKRPFSLYQQFFKKGAFGAVSKSAAALATIHTVSTALKPYDQNEDHWWSRELLSVLTGTVVEVALGTKQLVTSNLLLTDRGMRAINYRHYVMWMGVYSWVNPLTFVGMAACNHQLNKLFPDQIYLNSFLSGLSVPPIAAIFYLPTVMYGNWANTNPGLGANRQNILKFIRQTSLKEIYKPWGARSLYKAILYACYMTYRSAIETSLPSGEPSIPAASSTVFSSHKVQAEQGGSSTPGRY